MGSTLVRNASFASADTKSSWLTKEITSHLQTCMFAIDHVGSQTGDVQTLDLTLSRQNDSVTATLAGPAELLTQKIGVVQLGAKGDSELMLIDHDEIYAAWQKHPTQSHRVVHYSEERVLIILGFGSADKAPGPSIRTYSGNVSVDGRSLGTLGNDMGSDVATLTESCLEKEFQDLPLGTTDRDGPRHLTIRRQPIHVAPSDPVAVSPEDAAKAAEGPARGPQDAPVVVVAFLDYDDSFSTKALAILDEIEEHYPSGVRIVVRQSPVKQLGSQAAEAAKAAEEQGKFWEMHNLLFAHPRQHSMSDLLGYAMQLQLDVPRFQAALATDEYKAAVAADQELGITAGVSGPPSFVINGELVFGVRPASYFFDVINTQLGD